MFWSTSVNDCFCISEIQTTNNVIYVLAENFIFHFKIYKIFSYLLSFANFSYLLSSTEFVFAFAFFSHTISDISRNIANVSFSSSLNRLNAFSLIKILYTSACAESEFRLYLKQGCRDKHCIDKQCTTAWL